MGADGVHEADEIILLQLHVHHGYVIDQEDWLFNFVINPDVEPTNNRAERALRPSVIYRKISGGSRSEILEHIE